MRLEYFSSDLPWLILAFCIITIGLAIIISIRMIRRIRRENAAQKARQEEELKRLTAEI